MDFGSEMWLPKRRSAVSSALSGGKGLRKPSEVPLATKLVPKSRPKSPETALKPHLASCTRVVRFSDSFLYYLFIGLPGGVDSPNTTTATVGTLKDRRLISPAGYSSLALARFLHCGGTREWSRNGIVVVLRG